MKLDEQDRNLMLQDSREDDKPMSQKELHEEIDRIHKKYEKYSQ